MTAYTNDIRELSVSHTGFKKISVLGLGYVGLPVAAVFASRGFDVAGIDVNRSIVDVVNGGRVHIVEPDLDMLVQSAVTAGKLKAGVETEPADAFIIAVPTPFTDDHQPDLAYVRQATKMIAPVLRRGNLVVLESTSPVGTTEQICAWIRELRPDLVLPEPLRDDADIHVAHCPERVLPGSVLRELVDNDRIIGGISPGCAAAAAGLYQSFVKGELLLTTARSAELAKLVENAFRDVNIGFANELSLICDELNLNVWEVIGLANRHPRVNILRPGPGVGGHCIAIDPWFIIAAAPSTARIMRAAREVNDRKPVAVIEKIKSAAARLRHPVVACLGLTYKANIDDIRESPALHIVETLARENIGELLVVEPNLRRLPETLSGYAHLRSADLETAVRTADIIVLLVDHRQFRRVDRELLNIKIVIDPCGLWR